MASELRVNTINSRTGFGTITVSETGQDLVGITTIENLTTENTLVGAAASFTGNVQIGGVLTYEDVTNIDSVGLITARQGIEIGARPGVAASISADGNMIVSGISTFGGTANFGDRINVGSKVQFTVADPQLEFNSGGPRLWSPASNTLTIHTGGGFDSSTLERLRIDSSGRTLVGVTASRSVGTATAHKFQVEAVDATAGVTVTRCNAGSVGPYLSFGKSRAGSLGDNTVVQANDSLGMIRFAGADGTDTQNVGAQIQAFVDGTPGTDDMPGRLVFSTTADGANTATERLRITSDGTTEATGAFRIKNSGNTSFNIRDTSANAVSAWIDVKTAGSVNYNVYKEGVGTAYPHIFEGYTTEYARIDSAGIKFNGDTASDNGLDDYEQGSWNMTITPGGGSYSYGYGNTGYYVKVGTMVHCHAWVHLTPSSVSGGITWGGLPFTVKNTNRRQRVPIMGYGWSSISSSPQIIAELNQNGTGGSFSWLNDSWTTLTSVTAGNLGQSSEIYLNLTYEAES